MIILDDSLRACNLPHSSAGPHLSHCQCVFRVLFQVTYPVSCLFAALTETARVCTNNSHSGTEHPSHGPGWACCFVPSSLFDCRPLTVDFFLSPSFRKRLWIDSRHQLQRILVVHLFQNFVRHLETVNAPERMALAVILKIFVARFERAEIPFVFVHIVDVFSHQHAVLIFHQEIVRRIGLPPQFRQHRGHIYVHVRERIESFPQPLQIISVKTEMRRNKIRPGMLRKQMIALRHQRFKRRILRRRPRAARKFLQLFPAFVVVVPGIKKRGRLRYVNQHGKLQFRAFLEDGIELRIVRVHALAVRIFQVHSEILEDFQSLRAVLDVLFQARRHALSKSRRVQVVVTHVRENDESIGVASFHHRHSVLELFPGSSAEIHHHAQIDRVHLLDEPVHFFRRGIPVMAVNIDERKFRPLDFVFLGDERGLRLVLVDRRGLLLLWRLALLRHCGARPNEERSRSGNENRGNEEDGSPGVHSAPSDVRTSGLSSHRKAGWRRGILASVGALPLVSCPEGDAYRVLGPLRAQRLTASAPRLTFDSTSARQKRRTSTVFCIDLPSSLSKSRGRRFSTWPNSCSKASVRASSESPGYGPTLTNRGFSNVLKPPSLETATVVARARKKAPPAFNVMVEKAPISWPTLAT